MQAKLRDFLSSEGVRVRLQSIFSKGVEVIYEDALNLLSLNRNLLEELERLERLPSEITTEFLSNLLKKKEKPGKEKPEKKTPEYIKILKEYRTPQPFSGEENFLNYFLSRYYSLARLIKKRQQMKNTISIIHLNRIRGREEIAVIGMVKDIRKLKSGGKVIEIEDPTGSATVVFAEKKAEVEEVVLDDVIGIVGEAGRGIIFGREVVFPDVPFNGDWPKGKGLAVFTSDWHIGSKKFREDYFENFVEWVNKNREIKFLVVGGDLVDGIGVYKTQEKELLLKTAEEQYSYLAELLRKFRSDLNIVLIPGNHDISRDSEPQPPIPEQFAPELYKLNNVVLTSNPVWLELNGVKVLSYHGTSLDALIDAIEPLRLVGYKEPHKAMIEYLRRRHLLPVYGKSRAHPDNEDFMVIDPLPNVLHMGHVHSLGYGTYRGIRLICSATFQEQTDFQKKLGHEPDPGKVVVLDLSNGAMTHVDFSS